MARLRHNISYSDYKSELMEYKAYRWGATEDAFWSEDELVDHRPRSKKRKKKVPRGCPGNDMNEHVYVWVPNIGWWFETSDYEVKRCCGCDKRGRGWRRKTNGIL